MKPVRGKSAESWILSLVDSIIDDDDINALIAGPMTNPAPNVAIIRPRYWGRSRWLETSATQLCITGNKPPNIPNDDDSDDDSDDSDDGGGCLYTWNYSR